jgi:Zn-dependent peptidase ImmA (M78 family)
MVWCKHNLHSLWAAKLWQINQLKPPADVDKVARYLSMEIEYDNYLPNNISGYLCYIDRVPVIVINPNHSPCRQVFSKAHEIGEYILHKLNAQHCELAPYCTNKPQTMSCRDRFANRFAASLLMPENLIKEMAKQVILPEKYMVTFMAKKFGVSPIAMWRMLRELDITKDQSMSKTPLEMALARFDGK